MKYPVKVLFLDTVMDRGGAEAMTMNYLRHIDRSRVSFDFLVHKDYKAEYEDEITALGGVIYRICPPYPQYFFRYTREITALLREHPEYRILHSNMMENALPAYLAAEKCGVPIRICHAHIAAGSGTAVKSAVKSVYRRLMKPHITHRFACGRDAASYVFGSTDNVVLMKNAIESEKYRFSPAVRQEVRAELRLDGKFVVGHVGRFFPQKNHSFLVDIFAEIAKRAPDAVLLLVGGGELDDALMNRIKEKVNTLRLSDRVIFTGVRSDVERMLQAFDVFVLPSLYEGLPVVMIEAQAAGLPCVMSDRVTDECDITGHVTALSLENSAGNWADVILGLREAFVRKDVRDRIVSAGYDIVQNARWLENFYIEALQKYDTRSE